MWHGCIAQPTEQRKVRQHHSNMGTSRLIHQKLNALIHSSGSCWSTKHCAPPVSSSLRQHKSTTYRTETISTQYYSILALTCKGIMLDSAHLFSLHLSTILFLFCGLPLQCLFLLHLRCTCQVASPRPYQLYSCFPCFSVPSSPGSVLMYFLHAQTHSSSLLSLTETNSPFASVLPAMLAPLIQLIPAVCPKKTPGICIQPQSQGKQRTNVRTQYTANCPCKPKMFHHEWNIFPASPTERKNCIKLWQYLLLRALASLAITPYI